MKKLDEKLTTEIDALVEAAEKLARDAAIARSTLGPERIQELNSVAARGGQLIRKLYGTSSQHLANFTRVLSTKNFSNVHANHHAHLSELWGILKAVQHDLKNDLLADLRGLVQAEVFADFLEMAEYLLTEGYKDAAAVLLGAVLEDSLRKVASRHAVSAVGASGKPLTIDPLNVAISKAGAYGPLVQKQVTSWANLRNDAAHGNFAKYDAEQVKQMVLFIQKFCGDYLA